MGNEGRKYHSLLVRRFINASCFNHVLIEASINNLCMMCVIQHIKDQYNYGN